MGASQFDSWFDVTIPSTSTEQMALLSWDTITDLNSRQVKLLRKSKPCNGTIIFHELYMAQEKCSDFSNPVIFKIYNPL